MAELFNTATEIVTEMQKLRPGESITLSILRWILTQGTVPVFIPHVIKRDGIKLNYKDFSFEYEMDAFKSPQDLVPLTISRIIAS